MSHHDCSCNIACCTAQREVQTSDQFSQTREADTGSQYEHEDLIVQLDASEWLAPLSALRSVNVKIGSTISEIISGRLSLLDYRNKTEILIYCFFILGTVCTVEHLTDTLRRSERD